MTQQTRVEATRYRLKQADEYRQYARHMATFRDKLAYSDQRTMTVSPKTGITLFKFWVRDNSGSGRDTVWTLSSDERKALRAFLDTEERRFHDAANAYEAEVENGK